jgi:hypothetical protein
MPRSIDKSNGPAKTQSTPSTAAMASALSTDWRVSV